MKYLKVKLEDNKSILVDESAEIQEGDIATIPNYAGFVVVGKIDDMPYSTSHRNWQGLTCDTCFDVEDVSKFIKVIATINHSISLDVPMIVMEDEVEKIALNMIIDISKKQFLSLGTLANIGEGIILGYKAAQQKSYSEEDIINAFNEGQALNVRGKLIQGKDYIQSLKQEYIELEMETINQDYRFDVGQITRIKTNRVDGQLIAYIKKQKI